MSEPTVQKPEAQALTEFLQNESAPTIIDAGVGADGTPIKLVVAGKNRQIVDLRPHFAETRTAPLRRAGTARHSTIASFIEHVLRFKDADSAVFAEVSATPKAVAVLDYHRAGADAPPRFGKHRSEYAFPLSEQWKAWMEMDGEVMDQAKFAEFLENRVLDVAAPEGLGENSRAIAAKLGQTFATPQKLLELSRGLAVREGSVVQNAKNLSTGETQIQFTTQHTDERGEPLKVPGLFLLAIPVFDDGVPYEIAVRLRYRLSGGRIAWFYEVHSADVVLRDAIEEACARVAKETGLPVFRGTPE